jgi:amino acid permease
MASAGMIPGMITCIFSGSVAAFGLYLLSLCATQTPHRRASFFAVAQLTFPKAAVFFDAAIAIKCFGVSIRYADLPFQYENQEQHKMRQSSKF